MHKPPVIGFYSPVMQSGKTFAATHLWNKHGYLSVKFAGPLKEMLSVLYRHMGYSRPYIASMLEGINKERPIVASYDMTPRRMHQTLGTEWGRKMVHPDLWVDIATRRIGEFNSENFPVVVDDMRLPNEFEALRAIPGSVLVKVIRPGETPYAAHGSEGLLEDRQFDYTINNSGTLEDLYRMVDEIVELGANH